MLKNTLKKFNTSVLIGSLFLAQHAFATPSPVTLEGMSDSVKDIFLEQEKTQRAVAQDMKQYLGLLNLKDLETQNVMRLMLTPFFDSTVSLGSRVFELEQTLPAFQTELMIDTTNYNMFTPENASSDTTFISKRLDAGVEGLLDPASGGLDDLLASTLLDGYAYEDDAQAALAYEYIRNITNMDPHPALTSDPEKKVSDMEMTADELFIDPNNLSKGFKDPEEATKYLMSFYKQLPGLTLGQYALLSIHTEKQRFPGLAQNLPIGNPEDKSASLMEVMAYEVERRYMSEDWYNTMNQLSSEALLREIAFILASQSYMQFKNYERGQRVEAMVASQMSTLSSLLNPPPIPSTEEMLEGF